MKPVEPEHLNTLSGMLREGRWITSGQKSSALKNFTHDRWEPLNCPNVDARPGLNSEIGSFGEPPRGVAIVKNVGEISAILAYAHHHHLHVVPRGAGTGYAGGANANAEHIVLCTEKMNRILDIDPIDGVAVVEPGVITGDLADAAKSLGMFYPPDPASLMECSIGGNVATNAGGPRCLKYGVTSHYVLGMVVVLADGKILRLGNRCHKNRMGFALAPLFIGSEGLLGVIAEITLRLLPHPQYRGMLSIGFEEFEQAANCVNFVLKQGFLPSALEISDRTTINSARQYYQKKRSEEKQPCSSEKNAAQFLWPMPEDLGGHLFIEFDGSQKSVEYDMEVLGKLIKNLPGAILLEGALGFEQCERMWSMRRDFSYGLKNTGLFKLNQDVVVPRSKICQLVNYCQQLEAQSGFQVACFGHAGDGNIHVNLMLGSNSSDEKKRAAQAQRELFAKVLCLGGAITGEHGIGLAKKEFLMKALDSENMDVHRALKMTLDPRGILQPGKMFDFAAKI